MKLVVCDIAYFNDKSKSAKLRELAEDPNIQLVVLYRTSTEVKTITTNILNPHNKIIPKLITETMIQDFVNYFEAEAKIRKCDNVEYQLNDMELKGLTRIIKKVSEASKASELSPLLETKNKMTASTSSYWSQAASFFFPHAKPRPLTEEEIALLYNELSELFPAAVSTKDKVLMIIGMVLAVPAVIPNIFFGGDFVTKLLTWVRDTFKVELTPEEIKAASSFSASISGIANYSIFTLTMKGVSEFFITTFKNIRDAIGIKAKLKLIGPLVGVLGVAILASFSNLQFVKETLAGRASVAELTGEEIVMFLLAVAMNIRGIFGAEDFFRQMFDKKTNNAAEAIRATMLNDVNQLLPDEMQFSVAEIQLFKTGTAFKDKTNPLWRKYTAVAMSTVPPLIYTIAYGISAYLAAQEIGEDIGDVKKPDVGTTIFAFVSTFVAYVARLGLLNKNSYLSINKIFDIFFAEKILKTKADNDKETNPHARRGAVAEEIAYIIIGVLSLAGADDLVKDNDFKDTKDNGVVFFLSWFSALLGAGPMNHSDTRDFSKRAQAGIKEVYIEKTKTGVEVNKAAFGDSPEQFALGLMLSIIAMPNSKLMKYAPTNPNYHIFKEKIDELVKSKLEGNLDKAAYNMFLEKLGRAPQLKAETTTATKPTNPSKKEVDLELGISNSSKAKDELELDESSSSTPRPGSLVFGASSS